MPVPEEQEAKLVQILETSEELPVFLHPNMAQEYRKQIDGLHCSSCKMPPSVI